MLIKIYINAGCFPNQSIFAHPQKAPVPIQKLTDLYVVPTHPSGALKINAICPLIAFAFTSSHPIAHSNDGRHLI